MNKFESVYNITIDTYPGMPRTPKAREAGNSPKLGKTYGLAPKISFMFSSQRV